jgi:CO/xanthine dehydrogenase FAD-binding subunit
MADKFEVSQVYFPPTLNDAIAQYQSRPDAVIFAGGTWILKDQGSRFLKLPKAIISLHTIRELSRISRTESRLDIGATASIGKILHLGRKILPTMMVRTLEQITPPGVANLATLGGNVCVPGRSMTAFPSLHILDAKLEFRNPRGLRWIPATGLRSADGGLDGTAGEILTRIRLPLESWNIQYFRRIGSTPYAYSADSLVLAVVGKTNRGIVVDFRFALGSDLPIIYRNRDLEISLIGQKIPLSSRDLSLFLDTLKLDLSEKMEGFSPFQLERTISLIRRIVENLPPG